jgi:hypothetical protein
MNKLLAFSAAALMSLFIASAPSANAEDLLTGLPTIPNSTALGQGDVSSGGQMIRYSTPGAPGVVIESYKQALTAAGWSITGGGGSSGGGGFQATSGPKYLTFDAGGPQGTTYVSVRVAHQADGRPLRRAQLKSFGALA